MASLNIQQQKIGQPEENRKDSININYKLPNYTNNKWLEEDNITSDVSRIVLRAESTRA